MHFTRTRSTRTIFLYFFALLLCTNCTPSLRILLHELYTNFTRGAHFTWTLLRELYTRTLLVHGWLKSLYMNFTLSNARAKMNFLLLYSHKATLYEYTWTLHDRYTNCTPTLHQLYTNFTPTRYMNIALFFYDYKVRVVLHWLHESESYKNCTKIIIFFSYKHRTILVATYAQSLYTSKL